MIKETTTKQIKEALHLQCMIKFKPKSITIPKGWVPKTSYDHHLVALAVHDERS